MLADPKSEALSRNFGGQWLFLRTLENARPDADIFPTFDDGLRQAFRRETELFFDSILREDRSVLELLARTTRSSTSAGRALRHQEYLRFAVSARHPQDPNRQDCSGRAEFWPSPPTRTEPRWCSAENGSSRICSAAAPAAASARTFPSCRPTAATAAADHAPTDGAAPCRTHLRRLSRPHGPHRLRARELRRHWPMARQGCRFAHRCDRQIPGRTRPSTGPAGLTKLLLSGYREDFVHAVTEKLLTYALGRGLEYYDQPAVRTIAR